MSYIRQCREFPNKRYEEVERDEVKYLFDILSDNSITNIAKETGFKLYFISKTLDQYLINKSNYRAI